MRRSLPVFALAVVLAAGMSRDAAAEPARTWFGCPDLMDTRNGVARGQSRLVDVSGGRTRWLSACAPDGRTFPIRPVSDGCGWVPEPLAGVAWEATRMTYTDAAGAAVEVVPCVRRPGGVSVPLRVTTLGCIAENDWAAGVTKGMARVVYQVPADGTGAAPRIAVPCAPRPDIVTTWPHKRRSCKPPKEVADAGYAWSEIHIESDPPRVIRSCQPDPAPRLKVTVEGCDGVYVHDLPSGVSYATHRWYEVVIGQDGVEQMHRWITGCVQNPDARFPHVPLYTKWRHDDAARQSVQLTDTVVDTPTGRITLEQGVERLPRASYRYWGEEVAARKRTPIGCEVWEVGRRAGLYQRGDGSRITIARSDATAKQVEACR